MRLSAAQPMSVRLTSFYLPVRAGHGQKRMETEFFQIAVTYYTTVKSAKGWGKDIPIPQLFRFKYSQTCIKPTSCIRGH